MKELSLERQLLTLILQHRKVTSRTRDAGSVQIQEKGFDRTTRPILTGQGQVLRYIGIRLGKTADVCTRLMLWLVARLRFQYGFTLFHILGYLFLQLLY